MSFLFVSKHLTCVHSFNSHNNVATTGYLLCISVQDHGHLSYSRKMDLKGRLFPLWCWNRRSQIHVFLCGMPEFLSSWAFPEPLCYSRFSFSFQTGVEHSVSGDFNTCLCSVPPTQSSFQVPLANDSQGI